MEVLGNIWIESAAGLKMGRGRAQLLEKIEETGSVAEAARLMEMSYRRAWAMVKEMNEKAAQPLVALSKGGKKGGGAKLTPDGKALLSRYLQVQQAFQEFKNQTTQRLNL